MDQYQILERIGEGSFGRVYKARRKFTGQFVAMKFMNKSAVSPSEAAILAKLDHPNIVALLDHFETARDVVLVMEYAYGELFAVLCEDKRLPESVVQNIGRQLVSALHYLHSQRIMHRDMKPQNVLIGAGGKVMLADFGFSRQMSASTVMLTSIKGTPLYLAPEIFTDHAYEYKADLWGLGVMLYELAAGAPPFYANSLPALMGIIMSEAPKFPPHFSPGFVSFLSGLLVRDPARRAGWPELLHHPWVTDAPAADAEATAAAPAAAVAAAGDAGAESAAGTASAAPARSASGTPPVGAGAGAAAGAGSRAVTSSGAMVAPTGGRSPAEESKAADASPGIAVSSRGRGSAAAAGGAGSAGPVGPGLPRGPSSGSTAYAAAAVAPTGGAGSADPGAAGGRPQRRSVSATQRAARVAPSASTGAAAPAPR